jgi:hypothetical protein
VVRGQPDQSRHFLDVRSRQPGVREALLGEPGRFFLVLASYSAVHGIVEPRCQQHGPRRIGGFGEQVQGLQNCQQVRAAVIAAVVFAPAVQQVQEEGVVAGHEGFPAVQQRDLQGLVALPCGNAQPAGDEFADQDPGPHREGARCHEVIEAALRDVVVIAVERPVRDARRGREGVEFLERGV